MGSRDFGFKRRFLWLKCTETVYFIEASTCLNLLGYLGNLDIPKRNFGEESHFWACLRALVQAFGFCCEREWGRRFFEAPWWMEPMPFSIFPTSFVKCSSPPSLPPSQLRRRQRHHQILSFKHQVARPGCLKSLTCFWGLIHLIFCTEIEAYL